MMGDESNAAQAGDGGDSGLACAAAIRRDPRAALLLSVLLVLALCDQSACAEAAQSAPADPAGVRWAWQNPLPQGNALLALSCAGAMVCFATGGTGTILASADGGATWTEQDSGTRSWLTSISCPSVTICYALGQDVIVGTADGGKTWVTQLTSTPYDPLPMPNLTGISCATISTCVAVGNEGLTLTTADGGKIWTRQKPTTADDLVAVSCPAVNTCFAPGGWSMHLTGDQGRSWAVKSLRYSPDAMSCPSVTTCFGVNGSLIWRTTNGGLLWTWQYSPLNEDLHDITCPNTSACYAVGDSGTIIATTDGGKTWNNRSLRHRADQLDAISCSSATTCVAASTSISLTRTGPESWAASPASPSIWATTTGGATWIVRSSSVTVRDLFSVSCPGPVTCFAAGDTGTILVTTDGGRSWSAQSSPTTHTLRGITCPSTTSCFAVGDGGSVVGTTNGGRTWSRQRPGTAANLSDISCPGPTTCFIIANVGSILATTDGGSTWVEKRGTDPANPVPPQPDVVRRISCPSLTICYVANTVADPVENPDLGTTFWILMTTNGGRSWTSPASGNWSAHTPAGAADTSWKPQVSISCPTASTCFTVYDAGDDAAIFATQDGGRTWHDQFHSPSDHDTTSRFDPNTPVPSVIACSGAAACFAVGDNTTLTTADGGRTWIAQPAPPATSLNSTCDESHCATSALTGMACLAAGRCYAVGLVGAILSLTAATSR